MRDHLPCGAHLDRPGGRMSQSVQGEREMVHPASDRRGRSQVVQLSPAIDHGDRMQHLVDLDVLHESRLLELVSQVRNRWGRRGSLDRLPVRASALVPDLPLQLDLASHELTRRLARAPGLVDLGHGHPKVLEVLDEYGVVGWPRGADLIGAGAAPLAPEQNPPRVMVGQGHPQTRPGQLTAMHGHVGPQLGSAHARPVLLDHAQTRPKRRASAAARPPCLSEQGLGQPGTSANVRRSRSPGRRGSAELALCRAGTSVLQRELRRDQARLQRRYHPPRAFQIHR
jgi:hypothetical protein